MNISCYVPIPQSLRAVLLIWLAVRMNCNTIDREACLLGLAIRRPWLICFGLLGSDTCHRAWLIQLPSFEYKWLHSAIRCARNNGFQILTVFLDTMPHTVQFAFIHFACDHDLLLLAASKSVVLTNSHRIQ